MKEAVFEKESSISLGRETLIVHHFHCSFILPDRPALVLGVEIQAE